MERNGLDGLSLVLLLRRFCFFLLSLLFLILPTLVLREQFRSGILSFLVHSSLLFFLSLVFGFRLLGQKAFWVGGHRIRAMRAFGIVEGRDPTFR
jgi:hypothetical protein